MQKVQKEGISAAAKGVSAPKLSAESAKKLESSKKQASSFGSHLWKEMQKDLGLKK